MNPKKQKMKDRRRARKLAVEAWEAVDAGNLDLAEKIIRRAVLAQEDNPVLWNDQGVILGMRQKEMEAAESFRAAVHLAPTYADAYANYAALMFRQGFTRDAVRLLTSALEHAPDNAVFAERLQAYRSLLDETPRVAKPAPPSVDEPARDWSKVLAHLDWAGIGECLTHDGCVLVPKLLDAAVCENLRLMFDDDARFAKTVEMDRPDYGRGVYRYFAPPLPNAVDELRRAVYPHVAVIANRWQELLHETERFPAEWRQYRDRCAAAGQTTPTPILLKYTAGGFNALHRDLRGSEYFPIQLAVVLSPHAAPNVDGFRGGAFLLCDVPDGKKSRRKEIDAGLGDAILFCTRDRLVCVGGAHGLQPVKHGVAPITSGVRFVLGVPFHEYR